LSADLMKRVKADAAALRASTGHDQIPDDAITTSGSGLDPDISPAYALLQADRIAKARGVSAEEVRKVITSRIQGPTLGFLGQPHVNVLMTNLALDKVLAKAKPGTA
jgi:K+-transporting ATPase ATPase C chain